MTDYSKNILKEIGKAIESVGKEEKAELIDSIVEAKNIFIYGSGRSGLICQLFAIRLVQIGLKVHFVGEMTTPIVTENDLVILVSNTGKTMSVNQTAKISKRIGSKIISVTGSKTNPLAKESDCAIVISQPKKSPEYAPLGTIFEDSAGLFFDSIVPEIMKKKKITEKNMRENHAIWV